LEELKQLVGSVFAVDHAVEIVLGNERSSVISEETRPNFFTWFYHV